jgi:hypothetical protein
MAGHRALSWRGFPARHFILLPFEAVAEAAALAIAARLERQ